MRSDKIRLLGDWAPCTRKVVPLSFSSRLIMNLEAPVLSGGSAGLASSQKAGPSLFNLQMPSNVLTGISVLANNHLMDFGLKGFEETVKAVKEAGWQCVGAGMSRSEAQAPLIFDWEGSKVGLFARCETQFGVASNSREGVASFDTSIFEQIRLLKSEADFVIASVHAAAEMVPWPSPRRQQTFRSLIDAGADIIHGHHAHVPQGWEEYNGGLIFYGLGNFCVDPDIWRWHPQGLWSLAPELAKSSHGIVMEPKTTVIDELSGQISVREAYASEHAQHLGYLDQCNRPLSNPLMLEGLWQEASIRMYNNHFAQWLGFEPSFIRSGVSAARRQIGRLIRELSGQAGHDGGALPHDQLLLWYHLFACDSHNDAISTALGVLGGELEDLRTEETASMVSQMMSE